jgi:cephalosporin hydroxylase
VDPTIFAKIRQACDGKRTMAILDSDHSERHVLEELRLYSQLVTPGCYLICEDTNINGHPVLPSFGPGPHEALEQFLRESAGWLVDRDCERLLVTFNPSGYLLRLKGAASALDGAGGLDVGPDVEATAPRGRGVLVHARPADVDDRPQI